jgi:hypothetical protein
MKACKAAIPAQSLAVSSLDDDSIIGEQFARPLGPDAGQIVSTTDTTSHEEAVPCVIWIYEVRADGGSAASPTCTSEKRQRLRGMEEQDGASFLEAVQQGDKQLARL